jgi:hypothetical protein
MRRSGRTTTVDGAFGGCPQSSLVRLLMETEPNGVAAHCRPTATATVYAAFVLDLLSIGWHVEDGHGRALRIAKLHSNGVHLISLPSVASTWSLSGCQQWRQVRGEPPGQDCVRTLGGCRGLACINPPDLSSLLREGRTRRVLRTSHIVKRISHLGREGTLHERSSQVLGS